MFLALIYEQIKMDSLIKFCEILRAQKEIEADTKKIDTKEKCFKNNFLTHCAKNSNGHQKFY